MSDHPLQILPGCVRERLPELPSESVHCVVTSPPYWGLRDYGVAGQLGLEKTPEEYIANMVAIFREVRRVLRHDGTLWLNMGDCYAGGGMGGGGSFACDGPRMISEPGANKNIPGRTGARLAVSGLKPKDLVMMPARLALALQADGWYLRSDIIWEKPNPMPESIYDRPTKAHEYLFLLSKSDSYFYDQEAIREPVSGTAHARGNGVNPKARIPAGWDTGPGSHQLKVGRYKTHGKNSRMNIDRDPKHLRPKRSRQNGSFSAAVAGLVSTRNKRSVWRIATESFKGAHFATFPRALARPCIAAGTSEKGCCFLCAAPFKRIVELGEPDREHQRACGGDQNGQYNGQATKDFGAAKAQDASATKTRILAGMRHRVTVGWEPTCKCEFAGKPKPCIVMDPFGGSGTTAQVALELGRRAILIELNPDYIPLIVKRCAAAAAAQKAKAA